MACYQDPILQQTVCDNNDLFNINPVQQQQQQVLPTTGSQNTGSNMTSFFKNMFTPQQVDTNALAQKYGIDLNTITNPSDRIKLEQDLLNLDNMQNFDWKGWTGVGLGGINLLRDMSMDPYKKDYMQAGVNSLNQNINMANEAWQQKQDTRKNYSSAFSNAKNA
jgi:hypothetical protein